LHAKLLFCDVSTEVARYSGEGGGRWLGEPWP
jgi:hypothetical protein